MTLSALFSMTTKSLAIKFAAATAIAASFIPDNSLAFVNVESSYSSGGIETDSKMTVLPEIKDMFGFPISAVYDKIREFCGEPTAVTNTKKVATLPSSARPSEYTRKVREQYLHDDASLTWFVECEYGSYIRANDPDSICPTCEKLEWKTELLTLDEYEEKVRWFRNGHKGCFVVLFAKPIKFALVRTHIIQTDVTHKTNPERNYTKTSREISVERVVKSERDFYANEYVNELERRRNRECGRALRLEKRRSAIREAELLKAEQERQEPQQTPPTPPMPTQPAETSEVK